MLALSTHRTTSLSSFVGGIQLFSKGDFSYIGFVRLDRGLGVVEVKTPLPSPPRSRVTKTFVMLPSSVPTMSVKDFLQLVRDTFPGDSFDQLYITYTGDHFRVTKKPALL
jgi:hypothetical protein